MADLNAAKNRVDLDLLAGLPRDYFASLVPQDKALILAAVAELRASREVVQAAQKFADFQGQGVNPVLEPDEPGIFELERDLLVALSHYNEV